MPPSSAAPKRPRWLRALSFLVRLLLALWAELELRGTRAAALVIRPRYLIGGACQSNGICCHHLLVADDPFTTWPALRHIGAFWLCSIYRLRRTESSVELPDGGVARIYTCENLNADNRCAEYFLRPMLCRRYPRARYFSPPALHPGCGYSIIDRKTGEQLLAPPADESRAQQEASALVTRWRGEDHEAP